MYKLEFPSQFQDARASLQALSPEMREYISGLTDYAGNILLGKAKETIDPREYLSYEMRVRFEKYPSKVKGLFQKVFGEEADLQTSGGDLKTYSLSPHKSAALLLATEPNLVLKKEEAQIALNFYYARLLEQTGQLKPDDLEVLPLEDITQFFNKEKKKQRRFNGNPSIPNNLPYPYQVGFLELTSLVQHPDTRLVSLTLPNVELMEKLAGTIGTGLIHRHGKDGTRRWALYKQDREELKQKINKDLQLSEESRDVSPIAITYQELRAKLSPTQKADLSDYETELRKKLIEVDDVERVAISEQHRATQRPLVFYSTQNPEEGMRVGDSAKNRELFRHIRQSQDALAVITSTSTGQEGEMYKLPVPLSDLDLVAILIESQAELEEARNLLVTQVPRSGAGDLELALTAVTAQNIIYEIRRRNYLQIHHVLARDIRRRSTLVTDLLSGHYPPDESSIGSLKRRTSTFGVDIDRPFFVVATKNYPNIEKNGMNNSPPGTISGAINGTYFFVHSTVPLGFETEKDVKNGEQLKIMTEEARKDLRKLSRIPSIQIDSILNAGLGRIVRSYEGLPISALQAESALNFGPQDQIITHFDQLGLKRILLSANPVTELQLLFGDIIDPLEKRFQGSELVDTLIAYFEHSQNWTQASEALHVHHRTMQYRKLIIEQTLGKTVKDPIMLPGLLLAVLLRQDQPKITNFLKHRIGGDLGSLRDIEKNFVL